MVEYSANKGVMVQSVTNTPAITRCSFLNNGYYGILYYGSSVNLTDNTFGGNGCGAARWFGYSGNVGEAMNLSGNVISSNNGSHNGMAVSGVITGTPTWKLDAGFPYIVSYSGSGNDFTVNPGATLNLDPGVVMKFESGTAMTVQGL